eukprot:981072-Rhodomonas_salina.1
MGSGCRAICSACSRCFQMPCSQESLHSPQASFIAFVLSRTMPTSTSQATTYLASLVCSTQSLCAYLMLRP